MGTSPSEGGAPSLPIHQRRKCLPLPLWVKTYTFRAQDVYVLHSKRIRFRRKTYTFCPPNVYVRTRKGIRSDESPYKLSPCVTGEGKGKTWSFGEEGTPLLAPPNYSKPPVVDPWITAGGASLKVRKVRFSLFEGEPSERVSP